MSVSVEREVMEEKQGWDLTGLGLTPQEIQIWCAVHSFHHPGKWWQIWIDRIDAVYEGRPIPSRVGPDVRFCCVNDALHRSLLFYQDTFGFYFEAGRLEMTIGTMLKETTRKRLEKELLPGYFYETTWDKDGKGRFDPKPLSSLNLIVASPVSPTDIQEMRSSMGKES